MKSHFTKNIKVNVYEHDYTQTDKDARKRTSTTINYQICDFYFGQCLYQDEALKVKSNKSNKHYRKWLTAKVQDWANSQSIATSSVLEYKILQLIQIHSYNLALDRNKANLALDI